MELRTFTSGEKSTLPAPREGPSLRNQMWELSLTASSRDSSRGGSNGGLTVLQGLVYTRLVGLLKLHHELIDKLDNDCHDVRRWGLWKMEPTWRM